MGEIRVLGIGSPFGDDQVGWHVVSRLKQRKKIASPRLYVAACDRPGTQVLALMRSASAVFFIDAVMTGSTPGTLYRLENDEIAGLSTGLLSSHGLGLIEAIELGKALEELPRHMILYGIEIGEISGHFDMTLQIQQTIESVTDSLELEIMKFLNKSKSQ